VPPFVKRNPAAPNGFFECEAAGLRWLAAAESGVPCVEVIGHDATSLTLQRLDGVAPDRVSAREFGGRLARTHDAGAAAFGAAPDGWGGPGFFGPMSHPLPMSLTGHASWGTFYADERLASMAALVGPRLDGTLRRDLDAVMMRWQGVSGIPLAGAVVRLVSALYLSCKIYQVYAARSGFKPGNGLS